MEVMATDPLLERGKVQTGYRLSTVSRSFDRARRGEDPWLARGDSSTTGDGRIGISGHC